VSHPVFARAYARMSRGAERRGSGPLGPARRHTRSMPRRRKAPPPSTELVAPAAPEAPDDRAWSARRNVPERAARADLVPYMALPAETGPTWAPDQLTIWPVEGGRFGLDARYHGESGRARAAQQSRRLARVDLAAAVLEEEDGATLRLGPLAHDAAWLAIEAFLGRPIET